VVCCQLSRTVALDLPSSLFAELPLLYDIYGTICKAGRRSAVDAQRLLNKLYEKHWNDIAKLQSKHPELSAPLLIKAPKSYFEQNVKLMIIGQQTRGWDGRDIGSALKCYEDFNFGEHYYSSPFWNITRKVESALGIDKYAIVWSNLNRCDYNEKRPPMEIENELRILLPVLLGEIEILKPDVIFFYTGPSFDGHIKQAFTGSRFEPAINTFSERKLSRIRHDLLPHHSYRTYHPLYLRLSGIEPRFVEYVKNIAGKDGLYSARSRAK